MVDDRNERVYKEVGKIRCFRMRSSGLPCIVLLDFSPWLRKASEPSVLTAANFAS